MIGATKITLPYFLGDSLLLFLITLFAILYDYDMVMIFTISIGNAKFFLGYKSLIVLDIGYFSKPPRNFLCNPHNRKNLLTFVGIILRNLQHDFVPSKCSFRNAWTHQRDFSIFRYRRRKIS